MGLLALAAMGQTVPSGKPATASGPKESFEYWLGQSDQATQPADADNPADVDRTPTTSDNAARDDAAPGVIELSDGRQLPGMIFTTRDKPIEVWVESEKRWRRVPFMAVLSIAAVVDEEKMEPQWRWKEMGVPERVYTGKEYPTRRLSWRLHLIDDTYIQGAIKGQPVWLDLNGTRIGPMLLSERSKGEIDEKLADLIYIRRIVLSRKMMDAVLKAGPATATSRPTKGL